MESSRRRASTIPSSNDSDFMERAIADSGRTADADADGGVSSTVGDAGSPPSSARSHFECKPQGGNTYRPYWLREIPSDGGATYQDYSATPKGLLGQNAMTSLEECDQARAAANNAYGVICSRTGLDGWKPTLYTGTVPGRADFGYLGGSSITKIADCLKATQNSSSAGVCFWGGSDWYVTPIDREGTTSGPYATIDACVARTRTTSST